MRLVVNIFVASAISLVQCGPSYPGNFFLKGPTSKAVVNGPDGSRLITESDAGSISANGNTGPTFKTYVVGPNTDGSSTSNDGVNNYGNGVLTNGYPDETQAGSSNEPDVLGIKSQSVDCDDDKSLPKSSGSVVSNQENVPAETSGQSPSNCVGCSIQVGKNSNRNPHVGDFGVSFNGSHTQTTTIKGSGYGTPSTSASQNEGYKSSSFGSVFHSENHDKLKPTSYSHVAANDKNSSLPPNVSIVGPSASSITYESNGQHTPAYGTASQHHGSFSSHLPSSTSDGASVTQQNYDNLNSNKPGASNFQNQDSSQISSSQKFDQPRIVTKPYSQTSDISHVAAIDQNSSLPPSVSIIGPSASSITYEPNGNPTPTHGITTQHHGSYSSHSPSPISDGFSVTQNKYDNLNSDKHDASNFQSQHSSQFPSGQKLYQSQGIVRKPDLSSVSEPSYGKGISVDGGAASGNQQNGNYNPYNKPLSMSFTPGLSSQYSGHFGQHKIVATSFGNQDSNTDGDFLENHHTKINNIPSNQNHYGSFSTVTTSYVRPNGNNPEPCASQNCNDKNLKPSTYANKNNGHDVNFPYHNGQYSAFNRRAYYESSSFAPPTYSRPNEVDFNNNGNPNLADCYYFVIPTYANIDPGQYAVYFKRVPQNKPANQE